MDTKMVTCDDGSSISSTSIHVKLYTTKLKPD